MYIDQFYFKEICLVAYQNALVPIAGPNQWPVIAESPIFPHIFMKPPGRPKLNRKKEPEEEKTNTHKLPKTGTKMKCQLCFQYRHNKRTCQKKNTEGTSQANTELPKVITNFISVYLITYYSPLILVFYGQKKCGET